jgi:hypothetical protein
MLSRAVVKRWIVSSPGRWRLPSRSVPLDQEGRSASPGMRPGYGNLKVAGPDADP